MILLGQQPPAPGERARVGVATTTVWCDPGAPRPVDRPAVDDPPDPGAWVGALDDPARLDLHGRTATQALLGDEVQVRDLTGGWARVTVLDQPSSLDPGGYPGWVPSAHLVPWAPPPPGDPVVVTAVMCAGDHGGRRVDLGYGTIMWHDGRQLRAGTGAEVDLPAEAWAPVGDVPGLVAAAEPLLGLAYLWGGASGWGVDCSGLVWLAARRVGLRLARDAHDQAACGVAVGGEGLEEGDLVLFGGGGRPVHHVGIALGGGAMLHAPRTGGVVERARIDQVHPGSLAGGRRLG